MSSAFGVFVGLTGGLYPTLGWGSIGAAFGSSMGLLLAGMGVLRHSRKILAWDREFYGLVPAA